MKTIKRSTCARSGRTIRLVSDRGAYGIVLDGSFHGCGFDRDHAKSVFASLAGPLRTTRRALRELDEALADYAAELGADAQLDGSKTRMPEWDGAL